jgi:protoporphyrinogen oxidase
MRTSEVDGFLIDHGFQVYFEAYPNAKLELNLEALTLKDYEPGCLVFDGKRLREVHRENLVQTVLGGWVPINDLLRLHQLGDELDQKSAEEIWSLDDGLTADFLRARGVSDKAIERFIRPFFGGVFLDKSLNVSCRPFAFYWQMLDRAPATTPARGIQAIPDQVVESIEPDSIRCGVRVSELIRSSGRVSGVRLTTGEEVLADQVVLAVDQPTSARLSGIGTPQEGNACVTVWFGTTTRPIHEPILMVNGSEIGLVNHLAVVSNASRQLAPHGQHLVGATVLGNPAGSDMELAQSVRYELRDWLPEANVDSWRPLRVDRIPYAGMKQPVGFMERMPAIDAEPGLVLAGEHVAYSGIDGAVASAHRAVSRILAPDREPVSP